MTTFHFHAVSADDRTEIGLIEAANASAAARQLIERGLYPLGIHSKNERLAILLSSQVGSTLPSRVELCRVLSDLAHLLHAGVEIAPALTIMSGASSGRRVKTLLNKLLGEVRGGASLSTAMEHINGFPAYVISVVRVGEVSGSIADALLRLADTLRRTADLATQTRTALIYPGCLVIAVTCAITVLLAVVVPTLESFVSEANHHLPWQAEIVIATGRFIRGHTLALGFAVVVAAAAVIFLIRNRASRVRIEFIALRLPIIGPILQAIESARLAGMLAMLSSTAFPLAAAIGLCRGGATLVVTQDALADAELKVRGGASLHATLSKIPTLSARMSALVGIGEATGRLGPLLDEAARDAEQQVATAVERLLALLTPVLTIVFGAIAGFVLYTVMTSILSINSLAVSPLG